MWYLVASFTKLTIEGHLVTVKKIKNQDLLGEPLGKYHKIEALKRLNIYISAYQAIIRIPVSCNS